jgi:K+-transporting ATPase ATPase C chain
VGNDEIKREKHSVFRELIAAGRLLVATILICAVANPLVVLGLAAVIAPEKRMGSLVRNEEGQVIGSRLIAQSFCRPEYLWPRPSACGYDAAAAGGSNLSPTSQFLRRRAEEILARLKAGEVGANSNANALRADASTLAVSSPDASSLAASTTNAAVPADLVTASGSGLDPHISLAAAVAQVSRIAKARRVEENEVQGFLTAQAVQSAGGVLGDEPLVNVLEANLLLDRTYPVSSPRP